MNRRPTLLLVTLTIGGVLCACHDSGPTLDDIAEGPDIDPALLGDDRSLRSNEHDRLVQSLPPELEALDSHLPILTVDGSLDPVAIDASRSPVDVAWTTRLGSDLGFYLRIRPRPYADDVCPPLGTPLAEGAASLDSIDGFPHPLRSYREGSRLATWDLTDPPLVRYQHYYLQGCVVARSTGTFTGEETNTVDVEFVRALPDLRTLASHVFTSGVRKGEVFVWIEDRQALSDVRGDRFGYEIRVSRGETGYDEVHIGDTALNFGSGAIISTGPDFRVPDDGNWYDIDVRINQSRDFPESNYANNDFSMTRRVSVKPAVLVVDRIDVHENCDDRSPGDWQGTWRVTVESRAEWRGASSYFDVDETSYPTTRRPGFFVFGLADAPLDADVTVFFSFEDCDLLTAGCGEEWVEHPFGALLGSDAYQPTGPAAATLTPEHRRTGEVVSVDATGGECGSRPFTAHYRLLDPERAEAEGYVVRCGLDDTNMVSGSGPSVCH
jgi:hypothetical protein